ncbi:MAG: polyhydroxyalkanoic acid system family protein [Burkholderiales bacterium]
MSDIDIRRSHALSISQARKHAEEMASALKEKFDLDSAWDGDQLRFTRPGVTGALTVSKGEIHLVASLGLLLSFMKPQIEGHIHGELERIFSAPAGARPKTTAASKQHKAVMPRKPAQRKSTK